MPNQVFDPAATLDVIAELKALGGEAILREAAAVIEKRGWWKGSIRHRRTGAVDVLGAIALASGVNFRDLTEDLELLEKAAPPARGVVLLAALEYLDAYLEQDPQAWNDEARSSEDVTTMLRAAATRLSL